MQDEEFTVLAGVMGYIENGKEGLVQKGETVTLAAGIPHTFWNANPDKPFKNKVGNSSCIPATPHNLCRSENGHQAL